MFTYLLKGFPGGSEVKASASNAGDPGSILGREDKVFIEFVTVWFLFYVLVFLSQGVWNLSFLTDQRSNPYSLNWKVKS